MRRPAQFYLVTLLFLSGCSNSITAHSTAIVAASDVIRQIESTTKKTSIVVLLVEKTAKKKDLKFWLREKNDLSNKRGRVVYEARIKSVPYKLELKSLGIDGLSGNVTVEHRLLSSRAIAIDATYDGQESHSTSLVTGAGNEAISVSIENGKANKELLVVVVNF